MGFQKKINFIFAAFFAFCLAPLQGEEQTLPTEFTVTERIFSWTITFEIEAEGKMLGTVHRKMFSWTPEYHLTNLSEELLAKGTMRFWNFGFAFDITNQHEAPLGSVNEKLSWLFPTFEILSADAETLAVAELNFWETAWTVTDPLSGQTIAVLSRPFFSFINQWTVNILNPVLLEQKKIHPHMFFTLIAFQVDMEYWAAIENSQKDLFQKSNKAALFETLSRELESYRSGLQGIEPEEKDLHFASSLATSLSLDLAGSDEENFFAMAEDLIGRLSGDQLTKSEKAALFLLLEHRLR